MTTEEKAKQWASLALDVMASAEAHFANARYCRDHHGGATLRSTIAFMQGMEAVRSARYVLDEAYLDCAAPRPTEKGRRAR